MIGLAIETSPILFSLVHLSLLIAHSDQRRVLILPPRGRYGVYLPQKDTTSPYKTIHVFPSTHGGKHVYTANWFQVWLYGTYSTCHSWVEPASSLDPFGTVPKWWKALELGKRAAATKTRNLEGCLISWTTALGHGFGNICSTWYVYRPTGIPIFVLSECSVCLFGSFW